MKNLITKTGVQFGVLLSFYYILFNVSIFFIDRALFVNTFVGFFNIGVITLIGIIVIMLTKKRIGGLITFKDAFTPYLIMVSIGLTINYLTYNVLFNIVDPSAKHELKDALYNMLVETLKNIELTPEQKAEQLTQAKNLEQFTIKSQLFLWAGSILRYSILGLLLAAIFRNKSEFAPIAQQTTEQPINEQK